MSGRSGVVVGTAGHVDHGKTELVRALTGVWTDRLPEERARGISIELGFAPLDLGPGAPPASVVDVPGHEAFVRTMVAGATGIDAILFVVAADEGMMPQSREHLLVLSALGVARGVVAVTKSDLVDPEWLALVLEEVARELEGSVLAGAAVVPVSSRTGAGVEPLRAALAEAVRGEARAGADAFPFRLPVDRAFAVAGAGTVVTGTVWSGAAREGGAVLAFPPDGGEPATARIRSIEVHGTRMDAVGAGTRAALALAGPDLARLGRGAVLVDPAVPWRAVSALDARIALGADAPRPLARGARVRVHHGTREAIARAAPYEARAIAPGEAGLVRLALEAPLVAAVGDRVVLRAWSPSPTIGGGEVLALGPPRLRGAARAARARALAALAAAPPDARLPLALEAAAGAGIAAAAVPLETGRAQAGPPPGALARAGRWFAASARAAAEARIEATIAAHHAAAPLQAGLPLEAARRAARPSDPALAEAAIERLLADGRVERRGPSLALAGHAVELPAAERALVDRLGAAYGAAGLEPPEPAEIAAAIGVDLKRLRELQRHLEAKGALVRLASDRYADAAALARAEREVVARLAGGAGADVGVLKDLFGLSRKHLIPLLEHLDRSGVTRREGNVRVLARTG